MNAYQKRFYWFFIIFNFAVLQNIIQSDSLPQGSNEVFGSLFDEDEDKGSNEDLYKDYNEEELYDFNIENNQQKNEVVDEVVGLLDDFNIENNQQKNLYKVVDEGSLFDEVFDKDEGSIFGSLFDEDEDKDKDKVSIFVPLMHDSRSKSALLARESVPRKKREITNLSQNAVQLVMPCLFILLLAGSAVLIKLLFNYSHRSYDTKNDIEANKVRDTSKRG